MEDLFKEIQEKDVIFNIDGESVKVKVVGYNDALGCLIVMSENVSGVGWKAGSISQCDTVVPKYINDECEFWYVDVSEIEYLFNDNDKFSIEVLEGGKAPVKGSEQAACYDVYAREIIKVNDFYYKVKLGIKSDIPEGKHAKLHPRSGITDTGWALCNSTGIIDSDFVGEWQARFRPYLQAKKIGIVEDGIVRNISVPVISEFPYKVGDRVAQFEIRENDRSEMVIVDKITKKTERGEGGHNSTGLK